MAAIDAIMSGLFSREYSLDKVIPENASAFIRDLIENTVGSSAISQIGRKARPSGMTAVKYLRN
jgi:hypothetical protein